MTEDISIRGLTDFGGTPLRRFKGKLAEYNTEAATGYEGTRVVLNFGPDDFDALQATEVYSLPTASLNIGYSNKKQSRWGYFGTSLDQFIQPNEDLKDTVNRIYEMVYTDGQDGRPSPDDYKIWSRDEKDRWQQYLNIKAELAKETDDTKKVALQEALEAMGEVHENGMVPTAVWIVIGLDGAVKESDGTVQSNTDKLLAELIGKNRAEFNKAALALDYVKKDPPLQRAIMDKSFITGVVAAGQVYEDADGIFRAGAAPE